jgi:hypothetical protein
LAGIVLSQLIVGEDLEREGQAALELNHGGVLGGRQSILAGVGGR